MAIPELHTGFDDVVDAFALDKRREIADLSYGMGIDDVESLRLRLAEKYTTEVCAPRQLLWSDFDNHIKSTEPSWVEPSLRRPYKGSDGDRSREVNGYQGKLLVAKWGFESTLPDQQVHTEVTVQGWHVQEDTLARNLLHDLPKRGVGAFLRGNRRNILDDYVEQRIQNINGYDIEVVLRNLEADEARTVRFKGQAFYDTMITTDEMREIGITHDGYGAGQVFQTRPEQFVGTFSAPITLPKELVDFAPIRTPEGSMDISDTLKKHAYLFEQTPRTMFCGKIAVTNGLELFERSGDETLAYVQAGALFAYIAGTTHSQRSSAS